VRDRRDEPDMFVVVVAYVARIADAIDMVFSVLARPTSGSIKSMFTNLGQLNPMGETSVVPRAIFLRGPLRSGAEDSLIHNF
jgi:hypothetical protein